MAAVVVLPLVAETSTEPASSSPAMRRSDPGDSFSSIAPRRGGAAGAADAAAGGPGEAGEGAGDAEHQDGAMTLRQRRSTRMIAGVAPIGSPSA